MEVKINKDIRDFTENIFFGLSMRQFIFSIVACVIAVILYFTLKPILGMETVSWVCILGAVPFAVLGFVKYNGMTAEQFIWTWVKTVILTPKTLTLNANNYYYELYKESIDKNLKQSIMKNKEKKVKKQKRIRKEKLNENTK